MTVLFLLMLGFSANTHIVIDEMPLSLTDFKVYFYVDKSRSAQLASIKNKVFIAGTNQLSLGTNAKKTRVRFSLSNTLPYSKLLYLHIPEAYHSEQLTLYQVANKVIEEQHTIMLSSSDAIHQLHGGTAVMPILLPPLTTQHLYKK